MDEMQVFRDVPSNTVWVLRNALSSSSIYDRKSKSYLGYQVKSEGIRFRIPFLEVDEGLVNLRPHHMEVGPRRVNCIDGTQIKINVLVTWYVRRDNTAPISYLLNARTDPDFLVREACWAALNLGMQYSSTEAKQWGQKEKRKFDEISTRIVNSLLTTEKDYGIEAIIHLIGLESAVGVKSALERKVVAEVEKEYAPNKAAALKILIEQTGADPTKTVILNEIINAVRNMVIN